MRVLENMSREEWFEQRRGRVTASKIARLYDGGRSVWEDVRAEDRGEKPSFQGNEFTRWGQYREQDIADFARFLLTRGLNITRSLFCLMRMSFLRPHRI